MTRGAMRIQTGLPEFFSESPVAPPDTFVTRHPQPGNEGMDELATSYPTTLGDFTLFGFNPSHFITFPDFKAVCKKLALRFGTRLVSGLSHVRRSCRRCYFIGIIGVEAAT